TNYQTEAEKKGGAYIWDGSDWVAREVSWKSPYFSQTDNHPVVCISWNDAQAYCQWLSQQTGQLYRLPTEAEWEYACRAGTTTQFSFGNNENDLQQYAWFNANFGDKTQPVGKNPWGLYDKDLQYYAWFSASSSNKTQPVGGKKPNPWGLYDMHGNVWEWCEDMWHENYQGAPIDGKAWVSSGKGARVLRGGSWYISPRRLRAASRSGYVRSYRNYGVGMRLVRVLDQN
ncbi:MAG: hypothetical protein BWK79_11750, partial [Beggiatoa sp. IS2]